MDELITVVLSSTSSIALPAAAAAASSAAAAAAADDLTVAGPPVQGVKQRVKESLARLDATWGGASRQRVPARILPGELPGELPDAAPSLGLQCRRRR